MMEAFREKIEDRKDKKKILEEANIEAGILHIPDGVNKLLQYYSIEDGHKKMFNEQARLRLDKKAWMKGRTVNKVARWNLCFDDRSQEHSEDYKSGTIVDFKDVPITRELRTILPNIFGPKTIKLKAEGNYYYDVNKCYIGYHGDGERRMVIAARLGQNMNVYYQWYFDGNPYGDKFTFNIKGGDIYAMSDKATGTDWKKKLFPTLRHAAAIKESVLPKK